MLGGSDLALADHALVPGLLAPDRDDLGDGPAVIGHRHRHAARLDLPVGLLGQLIDLALLANGLLKGEPLSRFIRRSVELIG